VTHNLFILGSPRKNGNTETLARAVAEGLLQAKHNSVEFVHLSKLKISPCQACGGCSKTGNCIIQDDMTELYDKSDLADRLFFVSPVYFYAMSAQIKLYIDRCQARWSRKYLLGVNYRSEEQRTGHLLSCAATAGEKLFEGSVLTTKCLCDTLDIQYGPSLLLKNMEGRDALKNNPDELTACKTFGTNIALNVE